MQNPLKANTIFQSRQCAAPKAFSRWAAFVLLFAVAVCPAHSQSSSLSDPASLVNPMIGTGGDPDDGINLFPGASTPFGMVQLSPDTENHGVGYHHIQSRIKGFSMTHMSGPGCANEGDVFFTATTGPIVTRDSDYQSPYSHKQEKAAPGYYQVQLLEWGIDAEMSTTDRTGVARFTFPAGKSANVLLPISHTLNKTESASVQIVGDRRIEGFVQNHAFCTRKETYKVYFVMTFDRPFAQFGTWTSEHDRAPVKFMQSGRTAQQSTPEELAGAYASWPAQASAQTITAHIAISYVDVDGAEKNLQAEAEQKDFATIRSQAQAAWNRELSVIEVQGGTAIQRTVFYTALYHCLLMPSVFDDVDGRYLGFDGQRHTVASGHHIYANFSGWDIYRSEIPLLSMIEPRRMEDMAQSIVLMYQQGGWIDRWPQINLYTNDMDGSPLSIALATAWLDGLHGFDMKAAWEGMLKDATEAPPPGKAYLGEDGIDWVNKVHYVPEDQVEYSVSKTQEYALAYASLYRLATALGKTTEAKMLYDRALYYRNVFDPDDRFFRPRKADGSWVPDFNPALDGHGFTEGTGWHYQSFAPADLVWLIKAVGRDTFNKRMTEFFNYPSPGWYAQYYDSYNETDMQAPYVFNFSGQPWQTQRVVRRILNENYKDAPNGIPGNDDLGAMSSWAVLSMIGIYSVDPANLAYELVAPTFSKVVVHLRDPYPGKTFTIRTSANPDSTPYIQAVTLNGHNHTRNWISFRDISAGGALQFTLAAKPNQAWGSAPGDAPPSLSDAQ
jgi:predicted alpha-1,2-mannosidase